MSKYTVEVRYICETESGLTESVGANGVEEVLNNSVESIFGDFPIFDEAYRIPLEKKILRHYYTREIGFETVGLWKLKLNTKMNEIMPYYNKLYESELLEYNPLEDTNLTTEKGSEGTKVENSERKNSTDDDRSGTKQKDDKGTESRENWDLFSNTPQGQLSDVKQGRYLTTADNQTNELTTRDTSSEASTDIRYTENRDRSNKNITNVEDYIEKIKGKRGTKSYPELIEEFRKTFLNIDMMIIEELKDLFLNLW